MRFALSLALAIAVAAGATARPARSVGLGMPGTCVGCSFANRDLHGADLSDASYIGSDFAHADLHGANLRNADLQGVDFDSANLRGADLRGAKLCSRNTGGPNRGQIGCASFRRADVRGADLRGTLVCGGKPDVCTPLDAATLRKQGESDFAGAALP